MQQKAQKSLPLIATPQGSAHYPLRSQGITPRVFDITDAEAVSAFHTTLPRLDVQFNCAGIVTVGSLAECSQADWDRALSVNVTSIFLMMRAAVPLMQAGGGSIINMASVISSIGGAPQRFAYGASKAAVLGDDQISGAGLCGCGHSVQCDLPFRGRDTVDDTPD